jgi:tartrate-resistant acid phosphatase type 5
MRRHGVFCVVLLLLLVALSPQATQGAATIRFAVIGDYGDDNANEAAVAALVNKLNPDFIITTGDNSYGGTAIDDNIGQYYGDYIGNYTGSYGAGSPTHRFFPSLGNHDWDDGGGIAAYTSYFTLPGSERYYDFVSGPVHFFAVDSDGMEPDGNTFDSIQGQWLKAALEASTAPFKVVYLHHPPYSSSSAHGSQPVMQWPFEEWGATVVLAGHDHTYERIHRDDNSDGTTMPYFVTGLGGRPPYGFPNSGFVEGSQVRYNADYGAMLVEADDESITFEFHSVADGGTLIDSYTITKASLGETPPAAETDTSTTASSGCSLVRE